MLMRDPDHKVFQRVFAEVEVDKRSDLNSIRESLVGHFVWILILLLAIFLRSSL